jgi:copper chaperone CopZ
MKILLFVIAMMTGVYTSFAQIKSASLVASGLTCSMCSKSIFKALEKVPFVESIDVDIDESVFKLKFKAGVAVDPDAISKAVTDAGFGIASLKLVADFPATQVAKDTHIKLGKDFYHFIGVPEQNISGEKTVALVDKNFVSAAEFKKYRKLAKMKCYETGKAESCCATDIPAGTRIYHITL